MEFPRRPSQNEDPWYNSRETYDRALETNIEVAYGGNPSEQLRQLAEEDGWLSLWDPTNIPTRTLVSGNVNVLNDRLGNLPNLVAPVASSRLPLLENYFGGLSGMSAGQGRRMWSNFPQVLSDQATIVAVANNGPPASSGIRTLFDGVNSSSTRNIHRFSISASTGFGNEDYEVYTQAMGGFIRSGRYPVDTESHIFTGVFDGPRSYVTIDGQLCSYGNRGTAQTLAGIYVGADSRTRNYWTGAIGPILIYLGKPPQDVLNRMTRLLHKSTGIPYANPHFYNSSRVQVLSHRDDQVLSVGNPTDINQVGIASLTKILTVLTARKHLPSASDVDAKVTVDPREVNNTMWRAGDILSYRDLFNGTAKISSDACPGVIARNIGYQLLAKEGDLLGDPQVRFVKEMAQVAADQGWDGSNFTHSSYDGKMSPEHLALAFRKITEDPILYDAHRTPSAQIVYEGPEPRTRTVELGIDNINFPPISYNANKGGGAQNLTHLTTSWDHPEGGEYITVVTDSARTDRDDNPRYYEYMSAYVAVTHGAPPQPRLPGGYEIDNIRTTEGRNISNLFGLDNGSDDQGVFLDRSGDSVTITFIDAVLDAGGSYVNVLPVRYRPDWPVITNLLGDDNRPVRLNITRLGTPQIRGNNSGEVLNGSVTYNTRDHSFPETPYVGDPIRVNRGLSRASYPTPDYNARDTELPTVNGWSDYQDVGLYLIWVGDMRLIRGRINKPSGTPNQRVFSGPQAESLNLAFTYTDIVAYTNRGDKVYFRMQDSSTPGSGNNAGLYLLDEYHNVPAEDYTIVGAFRVN